MVEMSRVVIGVGAVTAVGIIGYLLYKHFIEAPPAPPIDDDVTPPIPEPPVVGCTAESFINPTLDPNKWTVVG